MPDQHHFIGRSQNFPEDLSIFVQKNSDDPAVKVSLPTYAHERFIILIDGPWQDFVPKLKAHLLPRMREIHSGKEGNESEPDEPPPITPVIFKGNRIYRHNILRINYTTYDMRRETDVINPRTQHCDILLLARDGSNHQFCYARVLAIFHANIIYTGSGSKDFLPCRIEFLWVRWLELVDASAAWGACLLDKVRFVPMNQADSAFGFVDPGDVLRSCHLVPAFATGKLHTDGMVFSRNARDSEGWKQYYANR